MTNDEAIHYDEHGYMTGWSERNPITGSVDHYDMNGYPTGTSSPSIRSGGRIRRQQTPQELAARKAKEARRLRLRMSAFVASIAVFIMCIVIPVTFLSNDVGIGPEPAAALEVIAFGGSALLLIPSLVAAIKLRPGTH